MESPPAVDDVGGNPLVLVGQEPGPDDLESGLPQSDGVAQLAQHHR